MSNECVPWLAVRATGLLILVALVTGCGEPPEAEQIFLGGNIVTADPQRPEVEALAVHHGRILAVGNREAVLAFRGEDTAITRLDGRALLPGFVAAHGRLPGSVENAEGNRRGAVRRALARYAEAGFTTVTVFAPGAALDTLRAVARSDRAPVRVQLYMGPSKRSRIPRLISDNEARFRVLGLAPGVENKMGDLEEAVLEAHRGGYQVALPAGTPPSMTRALDLLDQARSEQERADARHRLEGCTRASRDRLHRTGELAATCSFRAPEGAGAGTAERLGLRFSLQQSGAPDALALLQKAVMGAEPGERVPIDRAIRALTRDAAWQTHAENDRGMLKAGKYADLVLLDANPRKTEPDQLSEIEVLATRLAGRRIRQPQDQSGDES